MLSKKAVLESPIIRVTGTTMALDEFMTTISPVYVPTASVATGLTVTVRALGVTQQAPDGSTESQFPPVAECAVAANEAPEESIVVAAMICGKGLAPPKGFVKVRPLSC